ncbi:hypothetical protein [Luteibacter sp. dw_328]|uniref:hypothetical protein n=1 Tax=Luteibacter sp. dw_328 TaxID=2719796 RepID=UPI001BD471AE|nr:hypothetical protein [Luteibacter sp. dw_328]
MSLDLEDSVPATVKAGARADVAAFVASNAVRNAANATLNQHESLLEKCRSRFIGDPAAAGLVAASAHRR